MATAYICKFSDEVSGKAVILATGGFSCDHSKEGSLLQEFAPEKANFPTTNGPWATGRGIKMARAMGAALVGMQNVQVRWKVCTVISLTFETLLIALLVTNNGHHISVNL